MTANATTDFCNRAQTGHHHGAAAVQAQWARDLPPHRLTLIDTPAIDFAIEVGTFAARARRPYVFSAVDGVQPQSETVAPGAPSSRAADAFVNKIWRRRVVRARTGSFRTASGAAVGAGRAVGQRSDFNGWVDLVDERVLQWRDGATTISPWDDAARIQRRGPSAMLWSSRGRS